MGVPIMRPFASFFVYFLRLNYHFIFVTSMCGFSNEESIHFERKDSCQWLGD